MPQQTKIWSIVETRRHLLPDEHDQIGRLEQEIVVKKNRTHIALITFFL